MVKKRLLLVKVIERVMKLQKKDEDGEYGKNEGSIKDK